MPNELSNFLSVSYPIPNLQAYLSANPSVDPEKVSVEHSFENLRTLVKRNVWFKASRMLHAIEDQKQLEEIFKLNCFEDQNDSNFPDFRRKLFSSKPISLAIFKKYLRGESAVMHLNREGLNDLFRDQSKLFRDVLSDPKQLLSVGEVKSLLQRREEEGIFGLKYIFTYATQEDKRACLRAAYSNEYTEIATIDYFYARRAREAYSLVVECLQNGELTCEDLPPESNMLISSACHGDLEQALYMFDLLDDKQASYVLRSVLSESTKRVAQYWHEEFLDSIDSPKALRCIKLLRGGDLKMEPLCLLIKKFGFEAIVDEAFKLSNEELDCNVMAAQERGLITAAQAQQLYASMSSDQLLFSTRRPSWVKTGQVLKDETLVRTLKHSGSSKISTLDLATVLCGRNNLVLPLELYQLRTDWEEISLYVKNCPGVDALIASKHQKIKEVLESSSISPQKFEAAARLMKAKDHQEHAFLLKKFGAKRYFELEEKKRDSLTADFDFLKFFQEMEASESEEWFDAFMSSCHAPLRKVQTKTRFTESLPFLVASNIKDWENAEHEVAHLGAKWLHEELKSASEEKLIFIYSMLPSWIGSLTDLIKASKVI